MASLRAIGLAILAMTLVGVTARTAESTGIDARYRFEPGSRVEYLVTLERSIRPAPDVPGGPSILDEAEHLLGELSAEIDAAQIEADLRALGEVPVGRDDELGAVVVDEAAAVSAEQAAAATISAASVKLMCGSRNGRRPDGTR